MKQEDEMIRKWLIGYFNQYIIDGMLQVFGNGLNVKDVIAWLEKQGADISSFPKEQQKYMEKYTSLDKVTLIKLLAERDRNAEEITKSFEK